MPRTRDPSGRTASGKRVVRPPAGKPPQRRSARPGGPVTGDEPGQPDNRDTK
ncbi:hypothetical protein [Hyphomonas adhaerens]|uniref:hypothetical protein n=1 Tax=Hyphomonas adhaerens TaxID=81029 RepID=UPI00247FC7B0|nr:hypothetical protein [Hyphomonas adhaerens]